MKNIAAIALFIVATFAAAGPASAQYHRSIATVPFNFSVGDHAVPAGTYTISPDKDSSSLLVLNSWEKDVHIMTFGQAGQDNSKHANVLVFDKIGDKYYLRDIRSSDSSMNIHFPTTKAEKKAREQVQEAGLFVNDPVLIALN